MQFVILFIGVLVFVFYLFNQPPVFHNKVLIDQAKQTQAGATIRSLENKFNEVYSGKQAAVQKLVSGIHDNNRDEVNKAKKLYANLRSERIVLKEKQKR